jgi:hypothetical protein
MKMPSTKVTDIEEIAELAQQGQDVSAYFTGEYVAKQLISIDFPLELLKLIDAECRLLGIPREAWIKMACSDKLRQPQATLIAAMAAAG